MPLYEMPKPKVMSLQEELSLIRKHATSDIEAGRDWNDPTQGCACQTCRQYRNVGVTFGRDDA